MERDRSVFNLEDIMKNASFSGVEPGHVVLIVTTEPVGASACSRPFCPPHHSRAVTSDGRARRGRECVRGPIDPQWLAGKAQS